MRNVWEKVVDIYTDIPKAIKMILGAFLGLVLIGVGIAIYSGISVKDDKAVVTELEEYQSKFLEGEDLEKANQKVKDNVGEANIKEYAKAEKTHYANMLTLEEKKDKYLMSHIVEGNFVEADDGIYFCYTREDDKSEQVLEGLREGTYDVGMYDLYIVVKDVQAMYQMYVTHAFTNEDIYEKGLDNIPMFIYIKDGEVTDYLEANDVDRLNTWVRMLGG